MKILCVDDEELILGLTVSMCRDLRQKPSVEGFDNAADAIACLEREPADVAVLDINMPETDGIALAAKIKEISPDTAIIFLTGYDKYAVEAFRLHASGYLMKPVSMKRLQDEVDFAEAAARAKPEDCPVVVNTFGEFDVFVNGKTVKFARSRAKELLAYLVDRQGGSVTRATAHAVLWENGLYDRSMQKQLDVVIRSLRDTLTEYGIADIVELSGGNMRVRPEKISCDMYRFFKGDADAVNSYRGEYMSAYSWASLTEAYMDRKNNSESDMK